MNADDRQPDEMSSGIDALLGEFLHRELDGQTGRALHAFHQTVSAASSGRRAKATRRLLLWGAPIAGSIAAAVVLAMAMPSWRQPPTINNIKPVALATTSQDDPLASTNQRPESAPAEPFPFSPPPGADLTETVNIHDIDDGVLLVDGEVPMRQVRRQTLQRVSWFDPRCQADVEMLVPREQIVLVAVNPF